jgi:hypothetical protein
MSTTIAHAAAKVVAGERSRPAYPDTKFYARASRQAGRWPVSTSFFTC